MTESLGGLGLGGGRELGQRATLGLQTQQAEERSLEVGWGAQAPCPTLFTGGGALIKRRRHRLVSNAKV